MREHQMGELAPFQPRNQLLEVILGKLTYLFFEDGHRGLGRRGLKLHERCHILTEWLRDAADSTRGSALTG